MSTTLNLLTPPNNKPGATAGISAKKFKQFTVVQQVLQMFKPGGRMATFLGLLTGGCIPAFSYCVAHLVLPSYREINFTFSGMLCVIMWAIVLGGQSCSAPKVYKWFLAAYESKFEAVGAVVCLECLMTFVPVIRYSAAALAVLVFVNGVYCACSLQVRK